MKLEDFKLNHRMTVDQVRTARKILRNLLDLFDKAKNAKSDDLLDEISSQILKEMNVRTDEQDELMTSTLSDCLDLEATPIGKVEYLDMVDLFSQLYTLSTEVKKKQLPQSTTS